VGQAKSGNPCPKLMALFSDANLVITVKTVVSSFGIFWGRLKAIFTVIISFKD
jgi:hypothetical protein